MASEAAHRRAGRALWAAAQSGNGVALRILLHARAQAVLDTGGPSGRSVVGSEAVTAAILGLWTDRTEARPHPINGRPGLLLLDAGTVTGVISLAVRKRRITHLWIVLNPVKLLPFNQTD